MDFVGGLDWITAVRVCNQRDASEQQDSLLGAHYTFNALGLTISIMQCTLRYDCVIVLFISIILVIVCVWKYLEPDK